MPFGVEDLITRPEVGARVLVAIETEPHGKAARFLHKRHGLDITMAARAADAFGNVDCMVK
jgi:hypothetical protein